MKISLNWIKNYIRVNKSAEEVIDDLIRIGYDIESVEKQADKFSKFYIGKVLERQKHPNADKLSVCKVKVSDKIFNIVCGAPNVDAGQTVCVALEGAIIPNGGFEIKKSKIRGEISQGMICSAKELNLGDDHMGIMVLDDKFNSGDLFSDVMGYNDAVIDIAVTANRGDLLSHFGVARELGYLYDNKFEIKQIDLEQNANESIDDYISVDIINTQNCLRYYGLLVKNIKVKPSPEWMINYLEAVGLRTINNVVDITNFVMIECGQPLHAFDYRDIEGKKIIVKDIGDISTFRTLDGKDRNMRPDILMINDAVKPVGIAGIMGGENSEIKEDTHTVFIESAFFNPVSIRQSSKFLGLQTDSSYRFERGIDLDIVPWACKRAAALMAEYAEGEIVNGSIDNFPNIPEDVNINLRLNSLNNLTGVNFSNEEVINILEKIDCKLISSKDNILQFKIPNSRRYDIKLEVDLIEELIRLKGYENVPVTESNYFTYDFRTYKDSDWDFSNMIRYFMEGRGFKELLTDTIIKKEYGELFNNEVIELFNPLSKEYNILRNNLITGALESIKINLNYKINSYKLFEIGSVFKYNEDSGNYFDNIDEKRNILMVLAGNYDYETLNNKPRYFDLLDLKGEIKGLLEKLNVENYIINYYNYSNHGEEYIEYEANGLKFAKLFNIDKSILNVFDINVPVIAGELNISRLQELSFRDIAYKEIPKFPPVFRDLSVLVDRNVMVAEIEKNIKTVKTGLLKDIKLYDLYEPETDENNRLSYTFSLTYSSNEKTLTDDEVNKVHERIIKNLQNNLKAELRK